MPLFCHQLWIQLTFDDFLLSILIFMKNDVLFIAISSLTSPLSISLVTISPTTVSFYRSSTLSLSPKNPPTSEELISAQLS